MSHPAPHYLMSHPAPHYLCLCVMMHHAQAGQPLSHAHKPRRQYVIISYHTRPHAAEASLSHLHPLSHTLTRCITGVDP